MLINNYTSIGAITQAKNLNIDVVKDINILSQKVSGEQKFGKDDGQDNYYGFERNIGSTVKAENLNTTANNLNISGSALIAKTANLGVDKLNIESKVDKEEKFKLNITIPILLDQNEPNKNYLSYVDTKYLHSFFQNSTLYK